ncbi:MAG: stage 0 sporulation family protein [Clostridia bacterium]|nr:stage 0 sporulation family protein [Clostridia bacterium]
MRQKGIKIPYDSEKAPTETEKQEIVGVRFREAGKIYYFDPAGMKVPFGTPVIVETARGSEYGFTAISNRMIPVDSLTAPLKRIERIATAIDTQKHEANKSLEKDAEKVFLDRVEKLGLAMNLIYVEYTFDNSRLLFYFTAETRIDFRELVKELAGVFRTRIELRQIGVRDEAKMLGGMGICGRATCCNTFLGDFAQVSIKMAKDQSLSLNAAKISGACGKLMCCLRYEDKVYEEENARTPKVGSVVETAEGKGVVVERNALKGIVSVQLELSPEAPAKAFPREEVMVVGFNKSKDDDDIDSEELKKLQDS